MAGARLSEQAWQAYEALGKAGRERLLDGIDGALGTLEADPGSAAARQRSFGDGLWGIPVRDRSEDWLIVWEHDPEDEGVIRVRYLGADPFA